MNDLLTENEIEELTGARQSSKQADVLNRNGIYYILRMDKTIRVTWHAVHNPHQKITQAVEKPDFDAIERAG